jgi:hypothetical protein
MKLIPLLLVVLINQLVYRLLLKSKILSSLQNDILSEKKKQLSYIMIKICFLMFI